MGILDGNRSFERADEHTPSSELSHVQKTTKKQWVETLLGRINKNPEVVDQLHIVLDVIDEDKKKWRIYQRQRESSYTLVPLAETHVDLENFQNRRTPYSKYSVQSIMDSIMRNEFKKALMNPCILRKSPEGKDFVLAGHSRREAFDRLHKIYNNDLTWLNETAKKELCQRCEENGIDIVTLPFFIQTWCHEHNYYFDRLPSLYIQDMDFEDAQTVALMSNALASAETDVERADVYRHMRAAWKRHQDIEKFGKKCEKSNWKRIRALSYLAPNGLAMDTIYAFELGEGYNHIVKKIGSRIGELRRKMPELSNIHENELFDWLLNKWVYGTSKGKGEIHTLEDFIAIIKKHVEYLKIKEEFDPNRLLNINKVKDLSYIMQKYNKTLKQYTAKKQVLLHEFHDIRRQMSKLKATGDIAPEKRKTIEELENKLQVSLQALNKSEDIRVATDMLFDEQEVFLSPDEELQRIEKIQTTILEAIQKIEEEYYTLKNKKWALKEEEKNIIKIDFEA